MYMDINPFPSFVLPNLVCNFQDNLCYGSLHTYSMMRKNYWYSYVLSFIIILYLFILALVGRVTGAPESMALKPCFHSPVLPAAEVPLKQA